MAFVMAPKRRMVSVSLSMWVVLSLVGCGGSTQDVSSDQDIDLISVLKSRSEAASRVRPFDSISDVLANTRYRVAGQPPRPLTEAVVVGRFTDSTAGRGFSVTGEDAPAGDEVDFEDPDALWRTVHASLEVEEVISGSLESSNTLVGLALNPDVPLDEVSADLKAMGRVVVFLHRTPVFAYDPSVYGILLDGGLLGTLAGDAIRLPILDDSEESALLSGAATLDHLRRAAERPDVVVEVDRNGQARDEK